MRRLSFRNRVNAETVRFDRIEIEIGTWNIRGSTDAIDAFRRCLGKPPQDQEEIPSPIYGWIFCAPDNSIAYRRPLQIRKRQFNWGGDIFGQPLFQGFAKFSNYTLQAPLTETSSRVTLVLEINPTRWIRYQDDESDICTSTLMRRELTQEGGEFSLDGNDNWLPDSEEWASRSDPYQPFGSVQRYLDSLVEAWEEELNRAAEYIHDIEWSRIDRTLNVKSAESYWEFSCPDPTGFVALMERPMQAYVDRLFWVREYPVLLEERDVNSRSIRLESRTGETIRVYAKTNMRVRIEVAYQLKGQRRFQEIGPHTNSEGEIQSILNQAASYAAKAVNQLLSHLSKLKRVPLEQEPPLRLIAEILRVAGDKGHDIFVLLVHNNNISSRSSAAKPILKELRALKRRGVLESNRCRYTVAPRYRAALESLKESAGEYPSLPGTGGLTWRPES